MNETEWTRCTDPALLDKLLREKGLVSRRKHRLFQAAMCRHIWSLLFNDGCRRSVEFYEAYADGQVAIEGLHPLVDVIEDITACISDLYPSDRRGRAAQADLLHDLFGPLAFREARIDPSWLAWNGGAVRHLAETAYLERELPSGHLDAARLAVVADALEESGCAEPALLEHLRMPGPHVRGCWAIDALTGRG
jgi:hypothetical protein